MFQLKESTYPNFPQTQTQTVIQEGLLLETDLNVSKDVMTLTSEVVFHEGLLPEYIYRYPTSVSKNVRVHVGKRTSLHQHG